MNAKSVLIHCTVAVMAMGASAQTRQQMAIWDFGPNAAGYTENVTFNATMSVPVLSMAGGDKDNNGSDGAIYTDLRQVAHIAGQAATWNDVKVNGANASWTVSLDARNWKTLSVRFQHKGNATTPIQSVDIEYSPDGGANWFMQVDNASLVNDNASYIAYTLPAGTPFSPECDDNPTVILRFSNLEAGTGNNQFSFDNFEISGIRMAPTGVTATPGTTPNVVVTWNQVWNATGYLVRRSTTLNGTYTTVGTIANGATTMFNNTGSGVLNNTRYFYKVAATFDSVTTRFSEDSATVDALTPTARPGQPTVTVGNQPQVALTWTASAGTLYYLVVRGTAPGVGYTPYIATPNAASWTDTTVSDDTQYYYAVYTVNADYVPSLLSLERAAKTRLGPPVSVSAQRITPGQPNAVTISWPAVTGATSYKVYRSTSPSGPWGTAIATKTAPTVTHVDTTAVNYYYAITAISALGESRFSMSATPCPGALAVPTGVTATPDLTPRVILNWTAVPGTTTYKVLRSTTSGGTFTQIGTPATPSYTDSTAIDGTTYYYAIVASTGSGCDGPGSSQVRASVPPAPPGGLTATVVNGKVNLSWTASSGAASYNIKRSTVVSGPFVAVAATGATTFTDDPGGGSFFYVVAATSPANVEGRNSAVASASVSFLVLNEIKANPPGSFNANPTPSHPNRPDSLWEYIELKGLPGYDLTGHRVIVINGADGINVGRGRAMLVVPLSGVVPASGIVLIKQAGHPGLASGGLEILVTPAMRVAQGNNNPNDDLIINEASTILLAKGGTAPVAGTDYDAGENGVLDPGTWDILNQVILDSVGWYRDPAPNRLDRLYANAPRLQALSGQLDAATRIRENNRPNRADAWWFGELIGAPSALAYDTSDPSQLSGSVANQGAVFDPGAFLTPGAPNEPNTVAPPKAIVAPVPPVAWFVSPVNPYWFNQPAGGDLNNGYDYSLTIQGAPDPAGLTVVFNNNPPVFDNLATLAARFDGLWNTWAIRIMPDAASANRLITLLPDNDWARARSFPLSTIEPYPYNSTGPGSWARFTFGTFSDVSTAIEFDEGLGGLPAVAIGDDEVNYVSISPATTTLSQDLQVVREIDIEASARRNVWPTPMTAYWIGGMANGPEDDNYDDRPDRNRFFAADPVTLVDQDGLTAVGPLRGWSQKVRPTLATDPQYAPFRLAESMAPGVDSKQPWGFNVEAMELSPDDGSMYIGLRAPLVPAPVGGLITDNPNQRTMALIVQLNNPDQITSQFDDQDVPVFGVPITLNLGGRGFRSMTRRDNTYIIVAGPPTPAKFVPGEFAIFLWDGNPANQPVEYTVDLAGRNVEGIEGSGLIASGFLNLIEDNGAMDWYGDGGANKSFPLPLWSSHRKCRFLSCQLGLAINGTYLLDTPGHPNITQYTADGFSVSKSPDPTLGYLMGGRFTRTYPDYLPGLRPVVRPISSNPGDEDVLLDRRATSEVLPDDAVLGIYGNRAVGVAYNNSLFHEAVVWSVTSGAILRDLVNGGATVSDARGIASSTVVGSFAKAGGVGAFYESLDGPAVHTELPALPGATHSYANAINDDLLIVGSSGTATQPQACVWRLHYFGAYKTTILPQIPGAVPTDASEALGVNPGGTIVGYAVRAGIKRPCLWVFVDSRWQANELPALDATRNAEARDISSRGEVVGTCTIASGTRGCVWLNGVVSDLNTRIGDYGIELPVGSRNVTLTSANSINSLGHIVGTLFDNIGIRTRMYLMTPR